MQSVSIEGPGGFHRCLTFGANNGTVSHGNSWFGIFWTLPWKATYDVYSYSDNNCTPSAYTVGSHGTISPSVATRWAVYNARPPKRAF